MTAPTKCIPPDLPRRADKAALAKAQRRWGSDAYVDYRPMREPGDTIPLFQVGIAFPDQLPNGKFYRLFIINGEGESWNAAFKDADKTNAKEEGGEA